MLKTAKAIIACGLLFLVLAAGCDRPADPPSVTFAVGGAPAEVEFWQQIVADFTESTGIPVRLLRQPTDSNQRRQGLLTSLRARQSDPDVFLMDVAWLAQFAASGWLEPLEARAVIDGFDTTVFFPSVVELAGMYQDHLVALPVYVDGGLLYYRRDLLEEFGFEPPRTWDELLEQSIVVQEAMRETDPQFYGFVWQGAQYEGLVCNWLEFAASNRGGFLFEENLVKLNTPANVEATAFMHDLIHEHRISPRSTFTEMREEQVRTHFHNGSALFQRNWPYAWSLHQGEDSPVRGKTGIAALPSFTGGESVATLGGWHIGISAFSDNKLEAFEFLTYVLSYETQKLLALNLGWNPGRRDVYRDAEVLEAMPHFEELEDVFENLKPRPVVPYYTLLSDAIQGPLNNALAGRLSPQEALQQAQQQANRVIEQYEGR